MAEQDKPEKEEPEEPFPLLHLPRELRDMVIELVLLSDVNDELFFRHASTQAAEDGRAVSNWSTQPPLARVSRQTREEALDIYYSKRDFRILMPDPFQPGWRNGLDRYVHWLRMIGPKNRSLLRNFSMDTFPNKNIRPFCDDLLAAFPSEVVITMFARTSGIHPDNAGTILFQGCSWVYFGAYGISNFLEGVDVIRIAFKNLLETDTAFTAESALHLTGWPRVREDLQYRLVNNASEAQNPQSGDIYPRLELIL